MFHPRGPTFWELARQALSSTEHGYDLLAPKFDYTPFRTPDALLRPVASLIGEPGSINDALDLCCGTGAGMALLRPLCRRRVVGVDFSHNMLGVAKRNLTAVPGEAAVEFVRADVLDLPFRDEFDVAVCFGALGHIARRDQTRFVDQVAQALRPGGRFVFITADCPRWYSPVYWAARGFNAAMHVRNALIHPPFVMFYLTFLRNEATRILSQCGFDVVTHDQVYGDTTRACVIEATRRA